MLRNKCKCPHPPGGEADCDGHQLAICIVRNNTASTACLTPRSSELSLNQRKNWVLESVTGRPRSPDQSVTETDEAILLAGFYSNPITGDTVTFYDRILATAATQEGGPSPAISL